MKLHRSIPVIAVVRFALAVGERARLIDGVPFFEYETKILDSNPIRSQYADLFAFDTPGPLIPPGECKPRPGDSGWPSPEIWDAFDDALGGALIRTVPLAAPCYHTWDVYDAAKCQSILRNWTNPSLHEEDPTSVMWPLWQGLSCLPTDDVHNATCSLGGYPIYAVNATSVAQIQLAVNFARNQGLRLVVKNTGHDYQGRSSGAGALSIWTHNLQDLDYLDEFAMGAFSGPALHVGAGVVTVDMAKMADEHDASVVAGMCASVGYAGGYFAGGGHSPLSGIYGLAVDHVLAINVITADGHFVTASEKSHPDLFWALRGGGGSTFGVTTSVVVRLLPKVSVTTSQVSFQTSASVSNETFWLGVRAYLEHFDRMTQAGFYAYTNIRLNSQYYDNASYSLASEPMMAPNQTIASFNEIMKPLFDELITLGIPYTSQPRFFPSYYSAWETAWPVSQLTVAQPITIDGSRLFPRNIWNEPTGFETSFRALRDVFDAGHDLTIFGLTPGNPFSADNSVNPALRENIAFVSTSIVLADAPKEGEIKVAEDKMINKILNLWRNAAPASKLGGSYANEGNVMEPDWQEDFYGDKYERLAQVKSKWDRSGLFYVPAGVGSEQWEVRSAVHTQDGPLCRVH